MREGKRDFFICWFMSLMAASARQELGDPSEQVQGPKYLDHVLLPSQIHQYATQLERQYQGLKSAPIWHAGITGGRFACSAKLQAPHRLTKETSMIYMFEDSKMYMIKNMINIKGNSDRTR